MYRRIEDIRYATKKCELLLVLCNARSKLVDENANVSVDTQLCSLYEKS